MKQDPDDDTALDRLLFDYLEGHLDAARTQALEARLAAEAPLRDELALWKETVVQADLPDTRRLEAALLLPGPRPGVQRLPGRLVFVLVLLAALHWPLHSSRHAARRAAPPPAVRTAAPRVAAPVATGQAVQVPERRQGARPAGQRTAAPPEARPPADNPAAGLPETAGLNRLQPVALRLAEAAPVSGVPVKVRVVPVKAPAARPTRRQARQTARLKEKIRLQRQADAFLKGNVPYVVPLSGRNF